MAKRRKMTAKQLKYFGPRKKRSSARRTKAKVVNVARRRRGGFRRSARSFVRGGGGLKSMLAPVLGGVADSYLDPKLPIDGIGATAVGMFMHNSTLKDIGLYKVGMSIGNIIPLPGRSGGNQGALL